MKTPAKLSIFCLMLSASLMVNAVEREVVLACVAERLYSETIFNTIYESSGEKFELYIVEKPENIIQITTNRSTPGLSIFFSNAKNWHFKIKNVLNLSTDREYNIKFNWGGPRDEDQNLANIEFKLSRYTGEYTVWQMDKNRVSKSNGICNPIAKRLF